MSRTSFPYEGLHLGNVINVDQFHSLGPLNIKIVSGAVAGGGLAYILQGEVQPPHPVADLVAIKVILKFTAKDVTQESALKAKNDQERIRRELAVVQHVSHRYILPFIGAMSSTKYTVIASPFMQNGDMLKYITSKSSVKREPLILQVAIAVDHLHTCEGIVHGDLKCENVLISPEGEARLTDFGFSTPVEKPSNEVTTATAIRESMTLRFAAPELHTGTAISASGRTKSKTPESDVYAFGMLILQAFSGARPWPDKITDRGVVTDVLNGVTHPRLDVATKAGLSAPWWQLCQDCWKFTPEERPSMPEAVTCIRSIPGVPQLGEYSRRDDSPVSTAMGVAEGAAGFSPKNALAMRRGRATQRATVCASPAYSLQERRLLVIIHVSPTVPGPICGTRILCPFKPIFYTPSCTSAILTLILGMGSKTTIKHFPIVTLNYGLQRWCL